MAQYCNENIRRSIDIAITRFEAHDITNIIELETLLDASRLTHSLLSEHLELDPFDDMFAEVNDENSLFKTNGRIVSHIIQELVYDVFPNFGYNTLTNRFVRCSEAQPEDVQRIPVTKALPMYLLGTKTMYLTFGAFFSLYKSYFGPEHLGSLERILGRKHLSAIIFEISENVDFIIQQNATPFIQAIQRGMPYSTKLPPFEYGLKGL